MKDEKKIDQLKPVPSVELKVKQGLAQERVVRYTRTFLIGRHKDNDLQLRDACVSRNHAEVRFDGERWWVRDLGSANGTYLDGLRIENVPLPERGELELGRGGPVLALEVERPRKVEELPAEKKFSSETQIIQHYFNQSGSEGVGAQTMMFKRAFERAHKKRARKYLVLLGVSLFFLGTAGGVILYQKSKLHKLRQTAVDIFYTMKLLELQIARLEEVVLLKGNKDQVRELLLKRKELKEMERSYDSFVNQLGLYKKLSEEERIMVHMARLLGECEVNVPDGFVKEVRNYIKKWKSSDRLKGAVSRAKSKQYVPIIIGALYENNLPPHFFYLALQESGFEEQAVGPKTKYGHAKGIWQFIPNTAKHYDLKIGPLYKDPVYDPHDERFHFEKATKAAARYLRDINNTEAQASGLLVMAAYNWGETRIRDIIKKMPENPRERNFWCLLTKESIPQETYDYVFYIFSAAVICENPRLFGFDFDRPLS
jgi:pSer/pThr/pTyr-binding forkhead associated (FHA) protein